MDTFPQVKAAVVQAAPVLFDREATIEKTYRLTADAAAQGAQLILFPEALIPAYPRGLSYRQDPGQPVIAPTQPVQRLPGKRRKLSNRCCAHGSTWLSRWSPSDRVCANQTVVVQPSLNPCQLPLHQKVFIQQLRQPHLDHVGQQDGNITNSFRDYSKLFGHIRSFVFPPVSCPGANLHGLNLFLVSLPGAQLPAADLVGRG